MYAHINTNALINMSTCLCLYIFNMYTNPDNFKVVFEHFS